MASRDRLPGILTVAFAFLVLHPEAVAHDTLAGAGPLVNGLVHPYVVPAHVLIIVGCGLLLGQRGEGFFYPGLGSFSLGLALGLALSGAFSITDAVTLTGCIVLGLLIAVDLKIPGVLASLIVVILGFLLGFDSNPEQLSGWDRFSALSGVWLASFAATLWFFLIAAIADKLWKKVGVRVLGSWIAAISIMVIALNFAG